MKTCFFTILQSGYKNCVQYDLFEQSFKHFHPDVPLFVVGDEDIKKLCAKTPGLDMYKIKASAASLFYNDYDLVVNIDADHFIFGRMEEILAGDFDVAAPSNFNLYENVHLTIESYNGVTYNIVPQLQYIQAGLIASTSKDFWKTYEKASLQHANHMMCRDNDVLNMVLQFGNYNFKLLDGDYHPMSADRKCFYGCSSLNLENQCIISSDEPRIFNKPVRCYHVARGEGAAKPKFNQLFNADVVNWLYERIKYKL